MNILILGAGGIGGYFGAHLIRAGANVTYLVRDQRKALIDAQGLRVETPQGAFVVQPRTITAQHIQPDYDLIILAPKSYDLDDALQSLKSALGKGAVLPFLNGRDHLDTLDAMLGQERVMGGVAHIAATITPEGAIRQLTEMHRLTVEAVAEGAHLLVVAAAAIAGARVARGLRGGRPVDAARAPRRRPLRLHLRRPAGRHAGRLQRGAARRIPLAQQTAPARRPRPAR